ncbi:hypothetical protein [Cytobacillus sp. IB215665]|uniref:hypothetical protein n=1 Tax=Cytobacillus sp. IB215665 TaxID=3097357 RepID=UPI002A175500|nr:hypothetical protein [Cytobacillus sp. IB215665]MDX8367685.1 hypothetical protein [Cytobacillus sp. IB215665]
MKIELSKKDLRTAQLKASIWTGGNLDKFVSEAINTHEVDDKAPKATLELYIQRGENTETVVVKNVPHKVKEEVSNVEPIENVILSAAIEEILEEDFQELPKEIEFVDLVK